MNKLKIYISRAPSTLSLSDKYEVLPAFDPAELDLMVAFSDEESTIQGYELATAIEKYSKPVLLVSNSKDFGVKIDHPMFTFAGYSDISEIKNLIDQKIQKHFPIIEVNTCETDVCAV
jgi:hypothetical protein